VSVGNKHFQSEHEEVPETTVLINPRIPKQEIQSTNHLNTVNNTPSKKKQKTLDEREADKAEIKRLKQIIEQLRTGHSQEQIKSDKALYIARKNAEIAEKEARKKSMLLQAKESELKLKQEEISELARATDKLIRERTAFRTSTSLCYIYLLDRGNALIGAHAAAQKVRRELKKNGQSLDEIKRSIRTFKHAHENVRTLSDKQQDAFKAQGLEELWKRLENEILEDQNNSDGDLFVCD
jgi:hypothetical protein